MVPRGRSRMPTENPFSFQGLNPVPGGAGLRGARWTQCSGSHVNSQLPTHWTEECGWLGSCLGHPSPKSCNYSSSRCLSALEAGEHLCPGPPHQAHDGLSGRALSALPPSPIPSSVPVFLSASTFDPSEAYISHNHCQ